jgi:hypothetical protein
MFENLYARVCTMLNASQLVMFIREGVWAKADIENMLVTPNKPVAAYHRFYGIKEQEMKFINHLEIWQLSKKTRIVKFVPS